MTDFAASADKNNYIGILCEEFKKNSRFDPADYERFQIKRGLRNSDGTGVVAGLTSVCDVHGYEFVGGEKTAVDGKLIYRGIEISEIVNSIMNEDRFGFEETVWLLLFGSLPSAEQLAFFAEVLAYYRELPANFIDDMIIKAPSPNIMNKLARSVLALYSYDDNPDDISLENIMHQSIALIARLPVIMVAAYQVKRRAYDHKSMYFHLPKPELSIAENILRTMRSDKAYTREEAKLLDICLILHAEHGGGNNSTFATRVLSSSQTDTYSAISAGIGSLKGPLHGGANLKSLEMLDSLREIIENVDDDDEVINAIELLMDKKIGDKSGLIYGMGHAVYTKSDPRAIILRNCAAGLAAERGFDDELRLLNSLERLAPKVFVKKRGAIKDICANVDLYSGLIYRILGIPPELFTPIFAVSRVSGWCAHRIEEAITGGRIIRPAYKAVTPAQPYLPLNQR